MFCPRCGAENPAGNRYCSSCGNELRPAKRDVSGSARLRNRLVAMLGRSPRERALTAGTAVAILLALVAFLALRTGGGGDDTLTPSENVAADNICLEAKQDVAAAATAAQRAKDATVGSYAADLIVATVGFRDRLGALGLTGPKVSNLAVALRNLEIQSGTLARLDRENSPREAIIEQARRIDAATTNVDSAISDLGLERCARARIVPRAPS